ncbi:MAG: hypothetical protein ABI413_19695 [Ktedonobacteraceae bacterium]
MKNKLLLTSPRLLLEAWKKNQSQVEEGYDSRRRTDPPSTKEYEVARANGCATGRNLGALVFTTERRLVLQVISNVCQLPADVFSLRGIVGLSTQKQPALTPDELAFLTKDFLAF